MAGPASFPKGMPSGVSSSREFRRELVAARSGRQLPASWIRAWRELESKAQTDAAAREVHRRQIENKHGKDLRPAFGVILLVAGLLLAGWMTLT